MPQLVKRVVKKEEKEALVSDLKADLAGASSLVLFGSEGVTVAEITGLRAKLRKDGAKVQTVKNTLLYRATAGTALEPLQKHLFGSTVLCICTTDPITPVKSLVEESKKVEKLKIKAGAIDGKPLTEAEVIALSKLPSKLELIAKTLGSINAPAQNMVGVLVALPRKLVYAIDQIRQQKAAAPAA
ncbi:MAG: 50S ribosomal protein L10 [Bdellovibrionota bacterium]